MAFKRRELTPEQIEKRKERHEWFKAHARYTYQITGRDDELILKTENEKEFLAWLDENADVDDNNNWIRADDGSEINPTRRLIPESVRRPKE
jgi:hypothetical protein